MSQRRLPTPLRTQGLYQPLPLISPKPYAIQVPHNTTIPIVKVLLQLRRKTRHGVGPVVGQPDLAILAHAQRPLGVQPGLRELVVVRDGARGHAEGQEDQGDDYAGPVFAVRAVHEGRGGVGGGEGGAEGLDGWGGEVRMGVGYGAVGV